MAVAHDIPSGTLLDNRYLIQSILGRGGFGRTYLALNQRRWGEPCVLKEFMPTVTDEYVITKSRELFEREAKTLYKLEHPQIPEFLDVFEENGRQFLVQQYVAGQNYYHLLRDRQQFSPAEVLQWLRDLLPVLEYIHSQNIIHRDISPDNIILPEHSSRPVLIDFGVVKETVTRLFARYTSNSGAQVSAVVGKTGYAAPEQLRTGECYPSSDLYSLGVTAVVLLTGNLEPGTLFDSFNEEWRWSESVTLSPSFKAVLDKMMASRPKNRYQTANEVLADLEAVVCEATEPEATPVPVIGQPQPLPLSAARDPLTEINPSLPGIWALTPPDAFPVRTALEAIAEVELKTTLEANMAMDSPGPMTASLPPTPLSPLPLRMEVSISDAPATPILPPPDLPATPVNPLPTQMVETELSTSVAAPGSPADLPSPAGLPRSPTLLPQLVMGSGLLLGLGGVALATISPQISAICIPFNNCASPASTSQAVQSVLTSYDPVLQLAGNLTTLNQLDTIARKAMTPLTPLTDRSLQALSVEALAAKRQQVVASQILLQQKVLAPVKQALQSAQASPLETSWLQAAQARYEADLKRTTTLISQIDQLLQEKTPVPQAPAQLSVEEAPAAVYEPQPYYPSAPSRPAAPAPRPAAPAPDPVQLPLCPGNQC